MAANRGAAPRLTRRGTLTLFAGGSIAAAAGMLARPARADTDPRAGFAAGDLPAALAALFGSRAILASDAVRIAMVDIAEDGAIVPIEIEADLPRAERIAILCGVNPVPLIGLFELDQALAPYLSTRIKLAGSGEVMAVVDTGDALLAGRRTVRVMLDGCR
ncbi:MAG: thiosulfate oxidation carrier protein SoxY [Gammaproteobacteria bacterium]